MIYLFVANGEIFSWGFNNVGQCGLGGYFPSNGQPQQDYCVFHPTVILSLKKTVKEIAAGNTHSLCLTNEGTVFSWGSNDCGELGRRKGKPTEPGEVIFPIGGQIDNSTPVIVHISAGAFTSAAVSGRILYFS
jgi:alpha-tubulin suppressor-like RCC1 family protein